MSERLGFIGLGTMGQAMAGRLVAAGYPMTVWNRSPGAADALVARGVDDDGVDDDGVDDDE